MIEWTYLSFDKKKEPERVREKRRRKISIRMGKPKAILSHDSKRERRRKKNKCEEK